MAVSAVREDPGHGGADVGATGHGLQECDIVLEVSQLAAAMVRMAGVNVQLTRTRDVGLLPAYRSRALCQPGAVCVVSIHCNAAATEDGSQDPGPRGHEVYVSAFNADSRRLGECISAELTGRLPIPPRNPAVKTRLTEDGRDFYYVVRDPVSVGIPSVLVEVGFISNAQDAAYLATFWGRFSIAFAIARGVLAWLGMDPEAIRADLADARARLAEIQRIAQGGGD